MSSPRIPPLSLVDFSDKQRALVGDWATLNFSRVIVQHPELYETFIPFLDKLIRRSNLPPRDREVLVLRCLALCREMYEARHHVSIARKAGMTEAEIEAARNGAAGLPAWERTLAGAAEELAIHHRVSDETWRALAERYSTEQAMEAVFLVGAYTLMAMVTKSFGIALEDGAETFNRLAQLRAYT
jgi:4-carboxymuconolactone decarboxylase